jgi:hypothetical protein
LHACATNGWWVCATQNFQFCVRSSNPSICKMLTSTKRTFETPPSLSAYAPALQAMVDYCCTHQTHAQPHARSAASPIAPLSQPCHLDCHSCCLCRQQRHVCVCTVPLGHELGWSPLKSRAVSRGALWTAPGCSCGMWPHFQSCSTTSSPACYAGKVSLCKDRW